MTSQAGRILVVDDNKVNQKVLVKALTGQNHTATVVENGQQALDLLRAERPPVFDLEIMIA